MARSKLKILPFGFGLGGIIVLTFVSFIPCLRNDFVHFDDPQYVLDNPLVKSVSFNNIKKIFSSSTWGNYQPLVTLSFAVEYHFFRFNPYFYHLDNLLLHLINTVLVFYLIYLLTENSNIAFFTTILFAIHPMQVESVAWISERKNLLYAFFYFWALIVYILYVKKEHSRAVFYLFSVILFLCSLLSKGLAVSLVMILFAVDFLFKRKLNWTVLKEKIPFLGLALVFGLVTLHFQGQYHASWGLENKIPLNERILAASHIFFAYPVKLIWPLKLSCFYPFPQIQSDSIPVVFYVMSLVACILVYFLVKLRSQRFLIFCFLFFLFNIVWVLQILPMENFLIADRYVYVAGVGLFLLMARCLSYLLDRRFTYPSVFKKTFFLCMVSCFGFLSFLTFERCKVWVNSEVLYSNVLQQFSKAVPVYNARGRYYYGMGNYEKAFKDFNKVVELDPFFAEGYNNRAGVYTHSNRYPEALADFEKAVRLNPRNFRIYLNRGVMFKINRQYDAALRDFNNALEVNPGYPRIYVEMGNVYALQEKFDLAVEEYTKALQLAPDDPSIFLKRGITYYRLHRSREALEDLENVLRTDPDNHRASEYKHLINRDPVR